MCFAYVTDCWYRHECPKAGRNEARTRCTGPRPTPMDTVNGIGHTARRAESG